MNRKEFVAQQMNRAFQLMADGLNLTESQSMEIADLYEPWAAGKAYKTGKIVKYGMNADGETQLYTVLQDHTSQENWKPDTAPSLWAQIADPAEEWPAWSQPIGAQDAYPLGARVSHEEKRWLSTADNNVWEPGVYGWEEAQEDGV